MAVELSDHQLKAIGEMKNGCILRGGVGSGKSRTALAYFLVKECGAGVRINGVGDSVAGTSPRDLYVITTAKKRDSLDWEGESAPFAISRTRADSIDGIQLRVDSWNNIVDYEDVEGAFFIFDEQRLVGSGSWVKAFIKIAKANHWIMLSATPGDTWIDYIPVFVANGYYKNRTEFLRTHVVYNHFSKFPKVDHYVEVGRLEALRRRLLVEMPDQRHTVRHVKKVLCEFDADRMERVVKHRWNVFEEKPIKDVAELFRVMRRVVNEDPSRLDVIDDLLKKHPRLIVFYNFNYELDMLRGLAEALKIPKAEWNGKKHEEIPDTERWIYLVQYTAGAEGWNCVTTNATAFFSLNYSYKVFEQSQGRIDRMNTPYVDLFYYVLQSVAGVDRAISKSLAGKRTFNERKFFDSFKPATDDEASYEIKKAS